uniref:Uncharacterized protein n=1 Tax=Oryza nivara TaxID=4536 RepID=A0A0E0FK67_ORYNI
MEGYRGFRSGRGPIIGSHALCVRPIREGFLGVEEDEKGVRTGSSGLTVTPSPRRSASSCIPSSN